MNISKSNENMNKFIMQLKTKGFHRTTSVEEPGPHHALLVII